MTGDAGRELRSPGFYILDIFFLYHFFFTDLVYSARIIMCNLEMKVQLRLSGEKK